MEKKRKLSIFEVALLIIVGLVVLWMFVALFTPVSVQAAEMHGELEVGYGLISELWEFSAEIDVGQRVWILYPHAFAGWYTLTEKDSIINWLPWVQVYKVGAGLRIGEHLDISYTHYCMHPVDLRRDVLYDYHDFILQSENKIAVRWHW